MEEDRYEKRINKLRTTFDRKNTAISDHLAQTEAKKQERDAQKERKVEKMRKKFAADFVSRGIVSRRVKEDRQLEEKKTRQFHNQWLADQKKSRDQYLAERLEKQKDKMVTQLAEVTEKKTGKIVELEMKMEMYNEVLGQIGEESQTWSKKLDDLQNYQS